MNERELKTCRELARKVRIHCLKMVHKGKSGHIGSMLSMADILPVLYTQILNVDPKEPKKADRDRFILSKGHGGAALLSVLAERGFFPLEWLNEYYCDNGKLSGHISHHIPGVEFSTGSLGHGLPVACGMAMAARQANKKHRIFCMSSDGDLNEGSTWEAIMLAGQHAWDNLTMIVDYNRLQALGRSQDIIDLEPFDRKLKEFGWEVTTVDGHDYAALERAFSSLPLTKGKPSCIICRTVKGKGVSLFENDYRWHYGGITEEIYENAKAELEKGI